MVTDSDAEDTISKRLFKAVDKLCDSLSQRCLMLQMNSMEPTQGGLHQKLVLAYFCPPPSGSHQFTGV